MADQTTNPQAGVAPTQPLSIEQRLMGVLEHQDQPEAAGDGDETTAPEARPEDAQASADQATEELTPDDIPSDDEATPAQPAVDAFEIVHNGQQHKLSREETIRYAQQGFDYTQKTQQLAEQNRQLHDRLQRVSAIEQVAPQLQQAQAQVLALQAQVQRYQGVDWVRLATDDPLEYSKARAQYDVTTQTFQNAVGQYNQLRGAVTQQQQAIQAQVLQAEHAKLTERIPEWRDQAKYQEGAQALRQYLIAEGAAPEEVDALSSSMAVSIAYKAMQYDRLRKSKAEKVGQLRTAPPVGRPGAVQGRDAAAADKDQQLRARLRKSGSMDDAAALLFNRMK